MNIDIYKSHYKQLLYLGIPIMLGQLGIIVLGFADTMMIGHHTTEELAAASFTNNIFTLAIIFGTGFSYGLTPVIGELFGRNNTGGIGRVLRNSLFANSLIAIALTIIMGTLYFYIDRLGQPAELLPFIRPYYIVLLISLIFVMLFNSFKQFADGITDTRTSMWILIGGNILNIIGNYILIYGKLGFPELGLLGAGLSTLFSRIVMLAVFIFLFFFSARYHPYFEGFKQSKLNRPDFKRLNALGWPVGLQMGMETASFSLSAIMIGWLGSMELAAHQIVVTVSTIGYMIYYGMGAAIAIRVSNFKGQKDMKNVRRTANAGFHIITTLAIIASLLFYSLRNTMGGWFTDNIEVNKLVTMLVPLLIAYQLGDGMQITFANALRGISDVKPMMVIAFIAYFIIALPVGYLCGVVFGWGLSGVWMAFPFGLFSAGILLYMRFKKKTQKIIL